MSPSARVDPTRDDSRPAVSILLPARDAAETLPACLSSIRRQSLTCWECILVDDGSTDGTAEIAAAAARADPRFRSMCLPHRGLVSALNAGLDRCLGVFVARMDADDVMHRRRLEEQAAWLEDHADLLAVGCHVRAFPRQRLGPGERDYEAWLNSVSSRRAVELEAFVECPVAHPTLLARREALQSAGYRDMGWAEDYDLILRWLTTGAGVGVLPLRRLCWRHHPRRLSRTSSTYAPARFTACKAAFLAASFLAETDRYVLWGHGGTGRALRRELETLGKHASHIVELHPGRVGNRIHGAPVIAPSDLAGLPRRPVIASVAGIEPRTRIRRFLRQAGLEELRDFVCAA